MVVGGQFGIGVKIYDWDRRDSNPEPRDYESPALTVELRSRIFPARAPRTIGQYSLWIQL